MDNVARLKIDNTNLFREYLKKESFDSAVVIAWDNNGDLVIRSAAQNGEDLSMKDALWLFEQAKFMVLGR